MKRGRDRERGAGGREREGNKERDRETERHREREGGREEQTDITPTCTVYFKSLMFDNKNIPWWVGMVT